MSDHKAHIQEVTQNTVPPQNKDYSREKEGKKAEVLRNMKTFLECNLLVANFNQILAAQNLQFAVNHSLLPEGFVIMTMQPPVVPVAQDTTAPEVDAQTVTA
jgi:hypothetical protein